MMVPTSWREIIKSGPFSGIYAYLRRTKRQMRGEPEMGNVPQSFPPMTVTELLALPATMTDHARIYYSLGLAWLETDRPADVPKALACLRTAEALNYEGIQQITLYKLVIAARCGDQETVRKQAASLKGAVLNPDEIALLNKIVEGGVHGSPYHAAHNPWSSQLEQAPSVTSLIVVGDGTGASSFLAPSVRYVLAAADVTGLTPVLVDRLGLCFDAGFAPSAERDAVQRAGIQCANWLDAPNRSNEDL